MYQVVLVYLHIQEIHSDTVPLFLCNQVHIFLLTINPNFHNWNSEHVIKFSDIPVPVNPCQPSPCGPNSQCRDVNGQAVCSCLPTYLGSPPSCRPECVVNSECSQNRACVNQKCVDPCINTCGHKAQCQVIHHSPICTCKQSYTGDPFSNCYPIPGKPHLKLNHQQ